MTCPCSDGVGSHGDPRILTRQNFCPIALASSSVDDSTQLYQDYICTLKIFILVRLDKCFQFVLSVLFSVEAFGGLLAKRKETS